MGLAAGMRLGPHEIVEMIGAGGMGEVYKATDTRLNRTVAIKVLPAHFSKDPEMTQRFEREAQTIAALNHPHVCTLHDVGRQDGIDYLVMEFLEGETLAQRLERGPMPMEEALQIGGQIADALDKAHRSGVVHRDLKPQNVMLTPGGAKLMDFGLAKLKAAEGSVTASQLTTKDNITSPGAVLGTLQYMSPEQFEGIDVDARSDIFAFGGILYEMLTGRKAFTGKSRALLIGAIAASDPEPLSKVDPSIPAALEHVVTRCLAKDPERRWQTAHALMLQIQWIARSGGDMTLAAPPVEDIPAKREVPRLLALAAAAMILGVLVLPAARYIRGPGRQDAFEFSESISGLVPANISVSPDGRLVAFIARPNTGEASALFVRPFGSLASQRLTNTNDAAQPFWSPDSRWIAFSAGGKLRKVAVSGGSPQNLCDAAGFSGGAWSKDATIVFGSAKGLFRVSDQGGTPEALTTVKAPETGHVWPVFLPDGKHYLYLVRSDDASKRSVFSGTIGGKDQTRLMSAESNVAYAPPGYLLFQRDGTLFAQPFNASKVALAGDPIHVADNIEFQSGRGFFDVSRNDDGALIYFQRPGRGGRGASGRGQIGDTMWGWWGRVGPPLEPAVQTGPYGEMDLSPDGKLIAVTKQDEDSSGADIWTIDWQRAGNATRLTTDPTDDINPVWSPDGKQVAFTTYRKGNADIYVVNANGVGGETPLLETAGNESVEDWSKDGRYIAYLSGPDEFQDIYALPLSGDRKPVPLVQGHFHKDEPQFSFDGKWIAYTSDEAAAGQFEVYVQSFPDGKEKLKISNDGGGQPRWRRDGKELVYRMPKAGGFFSVDLKLGAKIEAGVPQALVDSGPGVNNPALARIVDPRRHLWAMTPDGQRFLVWSNPLVFTAAGGNAVGQLPAAPVQTRGRGNPSNRGGGSPALGRGTVSSGLTVVLHWTSSFRKDGK